MLNVKIMVLLALTVSLAPALAYGQDSVLQQARVLAAEEKYSEAVALLEGVAADSLTASEWYSLGTYYQALLQHEKALGALRRADTTNARVLVALGRSLDLLGQMREAVLYYGAAYRIDSTNLNVAASLATIHGGLGDWEEVRDIYQELVRRDENNAFAQAQLGEAYRMLDSTEGAIVHLERARRLDPKSLRVALQLSAVYLNNGYASSARRAVDAALLKQPDEPLLWQRSGDVAIKEENYEYAITSYRNALAYGDTTVVNLRNLGLALYLNQEYEDALDRFNQVYAADSTDKLNTFYLGMANLRLERYRDALSYLVRAKDLMGASALADIYTQTGVALKHLGESDEAIDAFDLALRINPGAGDAHYYLAKLYDELGNKDAAKRHYSEVLEQFSPNVMEQLQEISRQRLEAIRAEDSLVGEQAIQVAPLTTDKVEDRE